VHEVIGGFDECLPHAYDADYFWRLQLEGFELNYLPDAIIQVRTGRVSPSLSYMYSRGKNRPASNYWCYKRYRHLGMQAPTPLKKTIAAWLRLLKRGLRGRLQSKQSRDEWLQQFAQRSGNLMGELQGRIANPCRPYNPGKKALT
jgi:GT2 family glycosyltransferase